MKKTTTTRCNSLLEGWKEHAPDTKFGGVSLDQFQEVVEQWRKTQEQITKVRNEATRVIAKRQTHEQSLRSYLFSVTKAIMGDREHGRNSPILRGAGYKTTSDEKSGLTSKSDQAAVSSSN